MEGYSALQFLRACSEGTSIELRVHIGQSRPIPSRIPAFTSHFWSLPDAVSYIILTLHPHYHRHVHRTRRHVDKSPRFFQHTLIDDLPLTNNDNTMARGGGRRRGARITSRKGVFNPEDITKVKHTKVGVWDLYEEKEPELANIPGSSRLERFLAMRQSLPYLWQMLKDIGSIRSCWWLLVWYMALVVVSAMVPAAALW